jgi:ATP-dependent Lon protease
MFKNILIREDTAMTGEVSLQGQVHPIGGLKEKSLAALKHGLKRVIIPQGNKSDLKDFPDYLLKEISFIVVNDIKDVIKNSFYGINFDENNNLLVEVTPKF